jgi:hypothetical protein
LKPVLSAARARAQLGQALGDALAALGEALLELAQRVAAVADQRELAVEVVRGLLEQALALGRVGRAAIALADDRARAPRPRPGRGARRARG